MNEEIGVYEGSKSYILEFKKITYFFFKRMFDLFIALLSLIPLAIISAIVKISYMLSGDFESIFYTCDRIGKDGKVFKMYKFRTMVCDAEELLKTLLKNKKLREEYEKNHKLENDPRITKVGKVLRNTSIDELPQLLNVLKGEMTLIGNRPYLLREKEDMGKYYDEIIKTKPGLTGLWQVSGRSNTTFLQRLRLEEYYSNNYSLFLDLKIFFKTFGVLLFKGDAK